MSELLEHIKLHSGKHAIEVTDFVVTFGTGLDSSDIARLDERRDILSSEFPSIEEPQGFHIAFGHSAPPSPPQIRELTYFGNDGKPVWVAEFGHNQIVLSCRKYSGWQTIWPEALKRLNALLDCVDDLKPVLSIEYRVTDTFRADRVSKALTSKILFAKSNIIPEFLLQLDDPRWDLSHGRFMRGETTEILERIEANSSIENQTVVARITNLQSFRLPQNTRLKVIRNKVITETFTLLHDKNKQTLRSILTKELSAKMGL